MKPRYLHNRPTEELELELEDRLERAVRNLELSVSGPPRSRFAYSSAITRGRRAIAELERELRKREDRNGELLEERELECSACGSREFVELGTLGRRYWVRCRACGLESSWSS